MTNDLTVLASEVHAARRRLDQRKGVALAIAQNGRRLQQEIEQLRIKIGNLEKASLVLTSIGEDRQAEAQHQIESLVTRGLQSVWGEDLSFHVVQSVRAKAPNVDFIIRTTMPDGSAIDTEVMSARGGGMASFVGFLLRLVVMLLSKDKQESTIFLDETFGMVSAAPEPKVAQFLREIVDKTGIQIVMVTHSEAFNEVADKRYRFSLNQGETKVKEI